MENEMKQAELMEKNSETETAENLLEEARKINAELKENIKTRKELLEREERLKAQELLSGKSLAGTAPKTIDEEAENIRQLNEMLKSTGLHL